MAVPRPNPALPASFYAAVTALCDAVDAAQQTLADYQSSVANLQGSLIGEASARASGDQAVAASAAAALQAAIHEEQVGRNATITQLNVALSAVIAAERTARIAADDQERQGRVAAIQVQADALANAVSDLQAAINAAANDAQVAAGKIVADAQAHLLDFTTPAGRPGESLLRYALVATAQDLSAGSADLPPVPTTCLVGSDAGPVARLKGSGILAARTPLPIELGRLYRARYVLQRRFNPSDPSGDAVVCGIVYLDQSRRVIGDVVPVRTYPTLVSAQGRQEAEALISRSVGVGAPFHAPSGARFIVPVVRIYGADGITDVEVLTVEDVTGAFVLNPPVADFSARLAKIEADNLAARLEVVEGEVGTPTKVTFRSIGDASYGNIPATVQIVELLGRDYAGDGGAGLYARVLGPPHTTDTFTSHGAVFERVAISADVAVTYLDGGWEAFMAALPTSPPAGTKQRWNNGGLPSVTP